MNQNNRYPSVIIGISCGLGTLSGCLAAPAADSAIEDRQAQLGIRCEAQVAIAGHFKAAAPRPTDVFGCWPVGTWTFAATVQSTDCASPPALEREYSFSVSRDADQVETYRFVTDPDRAGVKLKVTSGGSGLCEGGVMIWSPDRKTLFNLKPTLNADGTVAGNGEIELYSTPQY